MVAPLPWVSETRDKTYFLNLNLPEDYKVYELYAKKFIMLNELNWVISRVGDLIKPKINTKAYLDNASPPRITIGVGFNMEALGARQIWINIFGIKPHFNDVFSGKSTISEEEAIILFEYSLKGRRKELEHFFKGFWQKLKANERIAIESLYYNSPCLVRKYSKLLNQYSDTNFSKNIKEYVATAQISSLIKASDEIKYNSNKYQNRGIQLRREAEALMLKS